MYGQVNSVGGDLRASCGDLDQVCEVARRLEAIYGSCRKFRSVDIEFKKVKWRCSNVESNKLPISMNW